MGNRARARLIPPFTPIFAGVRVPRMASDLHDSASRLGALEDDLRRRLYLFIKSAARPISREDAAREAGISRKLAAFHLDKLVDKGLLKAHYARPPGRSGPGAGRSSKLYEPSEVEIEVSIPARRYDIVGDILIDALESLSPAESPVEGARRAGGDAGRVVGERVRRESGLRPPGPERALSVAESVLRDYGYEPYRDEQGRVALRNCPFHLLSKKAPGLVCSVNQAFIDGMLRGFGNDTVDALLESTPGQCCVKLQSPDKEERRIS
jgi:predicted ArsR family transcriptional regulator